ncbi:hypothetical protein KDW99_01335 [Marinomonas rhizomae]|uniref:hypothetical protein n=1 Tax=Marinomonas rhizomae TaxID=491948 RepID=UPI002105FBFE|nr:hypothetical protein [Marinomonas rhizomae]UTV99819.1 hypothetical protein KDW99_01335 [Marinomonas rhizomae]
MRIVLYCLSTLLVLSGCSAFQTAEDRAHKSWQTVTIADQQQIEPSIDSYIGMERIGVITLAPSSESPSDLIEKAKQWVYASADYDQARLELGKVFYQDQNNSEAIDFYNQISSELAVLAVNEGFDLNADKVVYITKANDNLKSIAERFYGNTDGLIFLMRLNKLSGINLDEKRQLWIPLKKKISKPLPIKKAYKSSLPNRKESVGKVDIKTVPTAKEADVAVVSEPEKTILLDKSSNKTDANQSPEIDNLNKRPQPNEGEIKHNFKETFAESKKEVKGLSEYRKGSHKTAYSLLVSASNLSTEGRQVLSDLKSELIEKPYARGLTLYQEQKLEQAVNEFDQVLSVDPTYSQASVYRARCMQLLERLKTIQE